MKIINFSAAFVLTLFAVNAYSQTYTIDPGHTSIQSKVLRFGVVKVVGRFNSVSGQVNFDPANLSASSGELVILADSYDANNAEGEKAIKGAPFLEAAKFPEIRVSIKSLTKSAAGYNVTGTLTLKGVTKEITFPVTINGPMQDLPTQKSSIGVSGILNINRQDYGVGMSRKTPAGVDIIGTNIEIEINALAIAN